MGFYEVAITPEMIQRTLDRCERSGGEFNGSYHHDKGKSWGYLGEEIVLACLGLEATLVDSRNFDIEFKGRKIDVKTKTRSMPPLPHWDAMILASSMHQEVDWYFFVQLIAPKNLKDKSKKEILNILSTLKTGYVIGCIQKKKYLEAAMLNKTGSSCPNFGWEADAYTVLYSQLTKYEPQLTGIR